MLSEHKTIWINVEKLMNNPFNVPFMSPVVSRQRKVHGVQKVLPNPFICRGV